MCVQICGWGVNTIQRSFLNNTCFYLNNHPMHCARMLCSVYDVYLYAIYTIQLVFIQCVRMQPFHFINLQRVRQWLWMLNREQGLWFNLLPEYHSVKWYVLVHLTEGSSLFGVVNSFLWRFTVSSYAVFSFRIFEFESRPKYLMY